VLADGRAFASMSMIGRFLDDGDLRELHSMLIKKKPPAPSVRRRAASKRGATPSEPLEGGCYDNTSNVNILTLLRT
jgi:hypothetical protein